MQIGPRFSKNTAQNSSKHAISSEKIIFFWGGPHPPEPSIGGPYPRLEPSLLDPPVRVPEFQPDTPMAVIVGTYREEPNYR